MRFATPSASSKASSFQHPQLGDRDADHADHVSGTRSVKLDRDGRLLGKLQIKNGDGSTFVAERSEEPRPPELSGQVVGAVGAGA